MYDDLLPESVELFLDEFETSLGLPILAVIILCTAQFVGNHIFDVGYTIYQNLKGPPAIEADKTKVTDKLKGILGIATATAESPSNKNPKTAILPHDEEWDYCDDEDC